MGKLSKLHYSQRAHERLASKYRKDSSDVGITKFHYHSCVKELQGRKGVVLPRSTKKFVFKKVLEGVKRKEFK